MVAICFKDLRLLRDNSDISFYLTNVLLTIKLTFLDILGYRYTALLKTISLMC